METFAIKILKWQNTIFKVIFIKKVNLLKNTKDYLSNEIDDKVSMFALKEKWLIV